MIKKFATTLIPKEYLKRPNTSHFFSQRLNFYPIIMSLECYDYANKKYIEFGQLCIE